MDCRFLLLLRLNAPPALHPFFLTRPHQVVKMAIGCWILGLSYLVLALFSNTEEKARRPTQVVSYQQSWKRTRARNP